MKPKYLISVGILAVLNIALIYLVVFQGASYLYKENSWIENLQVLFLSVACGIYFVSAINQEGRNKVLCLFFTLICFTFVFREVDFEDIEGLPDFLVFMLAGHGRAFFFTLMLGLLVMIGRDIKFYWQNKWLYLRSPVIVYLCMLAPFMLIFSFLFDKKIWMIDHRVMFEELSEMTAYGFILASSMYSFTGFKRIMRRMVPA